MNEEKNEKLISQFLMNNCFSLYSLRTSNTTDEYYVKTDDYTFYYYKLGIINAYFLFDKDVSMEDINATKTELKNIKERLIKS